ncbi:hypothetical protein Pmani_029404 [Petrolisthes manimaculis]|uniref:Uncharacterized protein n=1 Tax=Petrolisthes manimaculis TaxID=1843537 RepID=A0AAE1TWZ8_9EUCA|nr:hypothetical protein Pmani_029404 [Petrolisthes manimaculis]
MVVVARTTMVATWGILLTLATLWSGCQGDATPHAKAKANPLDHLNYLDDHYHHHDYYNNPHHGHSYYPYPHQGHSYNPLQGHSYNPYPPRPYYPHRGYQYTQVCRYLVSHPHLLARLHGLMSYYKQHCYGSYQQVQSYPYLGGGW